MDFSLTEERRMLADSLRGTLKRGADWSQLAELGVLGALFTEDEGGFGGGGFDIAVVFEELGRAGSTAPILDAGLAGGLLADCCETALVERVIDGTTRPAFAHDEPGNRYDATVRSRASGDTINGAKSMVVSAEVANLLVVSAQDQDGLSLFAVEPGAKGVSLRTVPALSGGQVSEITFDNAPARRIGPSTGAARLIEYRLAAATLALCADALGTMETVKEMTLDYLRTRKQFGRPIGSFQALQHRMADLVIEIEQARSAVINLAGHLGAQPEQRALHVSATKNIVGRTAHLVAEESIQLHGGIAMTESYALGPLARRLIAVDHRFGDEDWHMERFIALRTAS
ncbi:MAG: putative acyl-CoA dehydrogenase [Rhodobacteraceae bacterium HLUCCA12]|nr:MAG: putative acyl-CoA dehydrogenase [Rhodobacteraceae bacterium HLUCCA12]